MGDINDHEGLSSSINACPLYEAANDNDFCCSFVITIDGFAPEGRKSSFVMFNWFRRDHCSTGELTPTIVRSRVSRRPVFHSEISPTVCSRLVSPLKKGPASQSSASGWLPSPVEFQDPEMVKITNKLVKPIINPLPAALRDQPQPIKRAIMRTNAKAATIPTK